MEVRSVESIVVSALNDAQVDYLIVGGLAVNAHGFVRLTRDVDIVFRLTPENATRKGLQALLAIGTTGCRFRKLPRDLRTRETRERWREEKGHDRPQTLER